MKSLNLISLLLITLILGCTSSYSVKEYVQIIKASSGLLEKKRSVESIEFLATYLPSDYQCLLQNRDHLQNKDTLSTLRQEYQNQLYFKFDIYINNSGQKSSIFSSCKDDKEYANLNRYLFESATQFKLIVGKDTLRPAFCQLERTYELSPYNSINLAFDPKTIAEAHQDIFLFYEDDWFNLGQLSFSWSESDLSKLPTLNTN